MKIQFGFHFALKILRNSIIFLIYLSLLYPKIATGQPANVVGYSTKVYATGTEKIKVKNPKSALTIFENKGIALMLPDVEKPEALTTLLRFDVSSRFSLESLNHLLLI
jgi:hypothetical protein